MGIEPVLGCGYLSATELIPVRIVSASVYPLRKIINRLPAMTYDPTLYQFRGQFPFVCPTVPPSTYPSTPYYPSPTHHH